MEQTEPQRLILLTRYPAPGTAKTRLIPALGAIGAADLSRQMTEHTLAQVQQLQEHQALVVEICFAGGAIDLMEQWLGHNWIYTPQGEGNLGDRMVRSLEAAFAAKSNAVVLIGSDCPQLEAALLRQAFTELTQHDLVLGPAVDGGYYLIGLRRFVPELFTNIAWSTPEVLAQTLAIAHRLHLAIALLPTLADVDHPNDLVIWHQVNQSTLNVL